MIRGHMMQFWWIHMVVMTPCGPPPDGYLWI